VAGRGGGDKVSTTWSDDLRFAEQSGLCVEVTLTNGQQYGPTGVQSVDEENGWAILYQPQYMGDETTTVRIWLPDITSVTVTDVRWSSD
jgi:hypothetical protein